VPKLLAAAIIAKDPARYGFADVAYLSPIEYDTVNVPQRTDLELVARICEVPLDTIKTFNPELRRWCTPPNYPGYELKIPKGKKAQFELEYAKIPEQERTTERLSYQRYRAGRHDTLAGIARRYGTTSEALAELNHLKKGARLRGKLLTIPVPVEGAATASAEKSAAPEPADKEFKKYYVVKKGDTLGSLAKRFNVSAKLLSAWNNLKGKVALRPGRRIIVAKYVEKNGGLESAAGKSS